ncbi:MAG: nucleotidyltransferase domain-containing protein [Acidobacteriota bacterium]
MQGLTRGQLSEVVNKKIERPVFATLAGDHLTGVPSGGPAAYRIAGAMLLPLRAILGLRPVGEAKERSFDFEGWPVDLSFLDLKSYIDRIARSDNTALLEELYSPQILFDTPEHGRLRDLARQFLNRTSCHDFLDRARKRRASYAESRLLRLVIESGRLCLAARHVLVHARLESRVDKLITACEEPWLGEMVQRIRSDGPQAMVLPDEAGQVEQELDRLERTALEARAASPLPEGGGSISGLDEFLVDLRLRELDATA